MAEVRIPVEKLPPPDSNGDHAFQFRVISVDKNQWSGWSQLYIIKSIGQYRPEISAVSASVDDRVITATWTTPTKYNVSASLSSASISHNHTSDYRHHDTDIFVQFGSGSVMGDFNYYSRVSNDTVRIVVPPGSESASVRVVGTVALKDIPQPYIFEDLNSLSYRERFNEYFGLSGSIQGVFDLFKIFDSGVAPVPDSGKASGSLTV
jgi:hypothetical protein